MTSYFSGKEGLLFHRNMLEAMDVYGARLSKDFQAETGIVVKHSFANRSMSGMRLRFVPGMGKEGIPEDFKAKLGKFVKAKKNYIKAYIRAAFKCTINDTDIKAALKALDPERSESTQWMGDSVSVSVK